MKALSIAVAASLLVMTSAVASAQTPAGSGATQRMDMSKPAPTKTSRAAAPSMTEGRVEKVDQEHEKITLKHGEIRNMAMPAMTMAFPVKDRAFLKKVKTGDSVKFTVESIENRPVITRIEPSPTPVP